MFTAKQTTIIFIHIGRSGTASSLLAGGPWLGNICEGFVVEVGVKRKEDPLTRDQKYFRFMAIPPRTDARVG